MARMPLALFQRCHKRLGKRPAKIAVIGALAAIDIFGDAAGKGDEIGCWFCRKPWGERKIGGEPLLWRLADGLQKRRGHRFDQTVVIGIGKRITELEFNAGVIGDVQRRLLDARDAAVFIEGDQPPADRHRGVVDNVAIANQGEFRGTAADIDAEHNVLFSP